MGDIIAHNSVSVNVSYLLIDYRIFHCNILSHRFFSRYLSMYIYNHTESFLMIYEPYVIYYPTSIRINPIDSMLFTFSLSISDLDTNDCTYTNTSHIRFWLGVNPRMLLISTVYDVRLYIQHHNCTWCIHINIILSFLDIEECECFSTLWVHLSDPNFRCSPF